LISELISLPKSQLDTLSAEGTSFDEIQVAAAMTPSSTRNRQIRYIAKLVFRDQDLLEKIRFLLETTEQAKRQGASQLHQVEYWREKILSGTSEDIFEFSSQFGGADQQQLRQLHRDFLKFSKIEKPSSKQQKAAETRQKEISRKTFKLIAETIRNSAGQ
jgi:ribosome-associated protein